MFGRSSPALCRIFLCCIDLPYERWHTILYYHRLWILEERAQSYCDTIQQIGGVLPGVFGFIDCTKIVTCRICKCDNLQKQLFSGLRELMTEHDELFRGRLIYGDPAYGVSRYLISPFKGNNLTCEQHQFNTATSRVHESVDWTYGRLKTLWAFVDFKKKHKVILSPVGKVVQTYY
ncbi:TPA: hypothetical protein N0F65_011436 [Lagenidium giganteum]|uniref:DDE Tnp4 domain-containing protein n=1 Tax=Lagenidium giganteum TaxID=4803 RepID=A0AAV2ZC38_9STRA|nr:TPA: hypothetical protein N0F65_011436 [Lagenidium giganteum]